MLTKLSIKNYALIEELSVEFDKGFNIITGETGAGKSIILGALGLILGKRADSSTLRNTAEKCIIEGVFSVKNYHLLPYFEKNDLDYDEISIFRREITPTGKSRAFINDTPVSLKIMSEIGSQLIDIHSQHQNLQLSNHLFQLNLVDLVAQTEKLLSSYTNQYDNYQATETKLHEVTQQAEKARSDLDYFEFQYNQLEEANIKKEEQTSLENEQEKLTHSEEIKNALLGLNNCLENDENSLLGALKNSLSELNKVKDYYTEAAELFSRLESVQLELKDISTEANYQAEAVEYDPSRLEFIAERLNLIYTLQQKHHVSSIDELLSIKDSLEEKISTIVDYDISISKLTKELKLIKTDLEESANKLSQKRHSVFKTIEKKVINILVQLGMPNANFKITSSKVDTFTKNGTDSLSFLFSANKDSLPDEISKVASGGETSRLMLAIKTLISDKKMLPTVIFDEIDSGISGEIAIKMGTILKEFSKATQIVNITHLPQIAGKGDHHYLVYKTDIKNSTITSVKKLTNDERIQELAKMVSGDKPTETAYKTAQELLK